MKRTNRRDTETELLQTRRQILDLQCQLQQNKEERRNIIRSRIAELDKEKQWWQDKLDAIDKE